MYGTKKTYKNLKNLEIIDVDNIFNGYKKMNHFSSVVYN